MAEAILVEVDGRVSAKTDVDMLKRRSDERIELQESDKVYNDKYFGEMRDSYKNKDAAEVPNTSFTHITNGEAECFSRNTKLALLLTEHSTRMMSWKRSTTKLQNQSQLPTGMKRPL